MEKKKQVMRFDDTELEVIKATFADNYDALVAIRKVMLQMPLNQTDIQKVKTFSKTSLMVIRKAFLPTLDGDAPVQQLIDLWMTIKLDDKSPEEALPHLKARELLIEYLDQQLKVLEGGKTETIKFSSLNSLKGTPEKIYSNLIARNTIVSHTEMQLFQFQILAGQTSESVEETKERLTRDSSK